jgi:bifunctional UDP-N-acetylglucosamine pyrophosphorylase/glucosamine-1-phosphate N-acetyltransferase
VSSGPQRHIERWALTKRAGTAQARAAEEALAAADGPDGGPEGERGVAES